MQLNEKIQDFENLGVKVVAISYDQPEQNARFMQAKDLVYQLLSDVEAKTVNAFGILNEQYKRGHPAYGIPKPGIVWVDTAGIVQFKAALPKYQERPPLKDVLTAIESRLHAAE